MKKSPSMNEENMGYNPLMHNWIFLIKYDGKFNFQRINTSLYITQKNQNAVPIVTKKVYNADPLMGRQQPNFVYLQRLLIGLFV